MKPTKYSGFCLQILGNFFSEKKKEHQIEKNILLEQANIEIDYEEYYSMTIMNMLIGYIGTLILTIFLHILAPYDNTIFFIIFR